MGYGVGYRTYHNAVVRSNLTQTLKDNVPLMVEEIGLGLDEYFGQPQGASDQVMFSSVEGVPPTRN